MKIAKFFAAVFGLVGSVLMVGTLVLCLTSLEKDVQLKEAPAGAVARSEELMEAVAAGDYAAVSGMIYGQPDLGADREPADEMGKQIWEAFRSSISYEFTGECYAAGSGIFRDATVTSLDIASVTEKLTERVNTLLTARMEAATDMEELYGEDGNFREDLVAEVLQEAVEQAIREDGQTIARTVSMELVYQDGQWWAVPDQALLDAISGDLA